MLVLVSILGGISFSVGAQALESYKLDKAAKILASDLREAREKAVAENVWQQVKFFPSTNMYRLAGAGITIEDKKLEQGIVMQNGYLELSFYPTGIPSVGTTIILGNSKGKVLKVIVAPVTGRVRISS